MRASFLLAAAVCVGSWGLPYCTEDLYRRTSVKAHLQHNNLHCCLSFFLFSYFLYFFLSFWAKMSRFKAVMFVIRSYSLFFFFFTIIEALWSGGQSSDFWSNFLAQSRFSSAVSWKNFQCLLKIAQGSTLCALTHKHTHLYAHTGARWPRLNVYNPILHPPPGRED